MRITALTSPTSAHRITEVRFFVHYDALSEFNGSLTSPGCDFSRVVNAPWTDGAGRLHPAGQSWNDLRASLIEAHADGLTPVVSIAGYPGPTARPAWDQPAPDPTTVAGDWELRCGVRGILSAISRLPAADQPHTWEAFNEPDAVPVYNGPGEIGPGACAVSAAGSPGVDGAAKAACAYALIAAGIHDYPGHSGDTVIAGTLSNPSLPYLSAYAAQLTSMAPGTAYPSTWSVHDYGDVTRSYAGIDVSGLRAFDLALRTDTAGRATDLWVTESGTDLTDQQPDARCGQPPQVPPILGACVNGRPARQALDAQAFFALPEAGVAVPVTHLFWYEWQGEVNWDSGLTDAAGAPRVGWCEFYGSGVCGGSPSVPPGPAPVTP